MLQRRLQRVALMLFAASGRPCLTEHYSLQVMLAVPQLSLSLLLSHLSLLQVQNLRVPLMHSCQDLSFVYLHQLGTHALIHFLPLHALPWLHSRKPAPVALMQQLLRSLHSTRVVSAEVHLQVTIELLSLQQQQVC